MPKKKGLQGVTVRISEALADALEAEIKQYPRPRPSRGELLERAWAAAGKAPTQGQIDEGLTPKHRELLERFVALLRYNDPDFPSGLEANIRMFERTREVLEERRPLDSQGGKRR